MERRLAAILAADVVGYSRLMEADEAWTLATLKGHRENLIDPKISEHHGRIVKLMGDGMLVEFASVVNAVACALAIQDGMTDRNEGVSEDRRIAFRIGVHLGDVMVEGDDLYGDGVNVAARLEGLAQPEGVCISQQAYDQVETKLDLAVEDCGPQQVKNIARPVHAYLISQGKPGGTKTLSKSNIHPPPSKPSIAVLPFDNMSDSPEQTYFSDGITEDIITELTRFRTLFVIARNSTFAFRDERLDASEIGRRLGVQYLLEGSVRRSGNRLRVIAQLVETASGNHLWAERYDRNVEDLFDIQDELARTIVGTLAGRLETSAMAAAKRQRPDNMLAYDFLLRGIDCQQRLTKMENEKARNLLERSIAIDPEFALPYAWLALTWTADWEIDLDQAYRLASKSVTLDDSESRCHVIFGFVCLLRKEFEKALAHTERAVALNPNESHGIAHLSLVYCFTGQPERAIDLMAEAMQINPFYPSWYDTFLAYALYKLRRYEEAATKLLRLSTRSIWGNAIAAACAAQAGMLDQAHQHANLVLEECPGFSARKHAMADPFSEPMDAEHLLEGLYKAGLPA